MTITDIVMLTVGISTVLGSLVSVIYTITNRPTFSFCEKTFQRKDLHSQEYNTLLEKIEELKEAIEHLQEKTK